ncbi:hypothetical protein K470DRAFT_238625 [Piedraia hortae CBS 480.64]|uniref:NACHT domain-containing protein n=1 Tax=Piedraia hortae CBS 480.64 TaxID=1314780 RepID=A0A6A7BPU9_9PEZI|nr:hypothetical protein K470DRAFT_238625 [Piedraia hortae CBS 480.64]
MPWRSSRQKYHSSTAVQHSVGALLQPTMSKDPRDPHQLRGLALDKLNDREREEILRKLNENGHAIEDLTFLEDEAKKLEEVVTRVNGWGRAIRKTERILASIYRFRDSGASLGNMQSLYLGGVWACVNVLLVIAVEQKARREALIDALDTVTYTCSLLSIYHDWFCKLPPSNQAERLGNDLVELFAQVYRILANAMLAHSASAWKKFCNTVKNDFNLKGMQERCGELRHKVRDGVAMCDRESYDGWTRGLNNQLDQLETDLRNAVARVEGKLDSANLKLDLKGLKEAKGAVYDAQNSYCSQGTREALIWEITRWAEDPPKDKRIMWLSGMAGTGKTTLARTVAKVMDSGGEFLVASFFFNRAVGDLGKLSYIVPTMAKQLTGELRSVAESIASVLAKDSQACEKHVGIQFQKLLKTPLELASDADSRTPMFFVIDSLDECDNTDDIEVVLLHLAKLVEIPSIDLRVLITSRPDYAKHFNFPNSGYVHKVLDREQEHTIEGDIRVFFRETFEKIRARHDLDEDWPGDSAIETLVSNSQPLFIVAATACRMLKQGDPELQLEEMLEMNYDLFSGNGLGSMYLSILKQAERYAGGARGTTWVSSFQEIVKPLIVLRNGLSANALAELLGRPVRKVKQVLNPLHSVIHLPADNIEPITTYHLSFREFLINLDGEDQAKFGVDVKTTHGVLFGKCLELLDAGFEQRVMGDLANAVERGMCGPACPGAYVDQRQVEHYISKAEEYAARYWISHLVGSHPGWKDFQRADAFLQKHFLHWIETVCWLRIVDEAFVNIKNLRAAFEASHHKPDMTRVVETEPLDDFLNDAIRWMSRFRDIIAISPLQAYFAALAYAPYKSLVRTRFKHVIAKCLEVVPQKTDDWSAELQTLRSDQSLLGTAVSPDGKTIAARTKTGDIVIWNTETNTHQFLKTSRNDYIRFLPNNDELVSIRSSGIDLCNVKTRTIRSLFEVGVEDRSLIKRLAISPNLQTIVIFDQHVGIFSLYDVRTKMKITCKSGKTDLKCKPEFPPDSEVVAVSLKDQSVGLWWTKTGAEKARFTGHSSSVKALSFAKHGRLLVSVSRDGTVYVWATSTESLERRLKFSFSDFLGFSFSPEGEILAGVSEDWKVHLLDLHTEEENILLGIQISSTNIRVTSNGTQVVTTAGSSLKIWDTKLAMQRQAPLELGHLRHLVIHPDQYKVALASRQNPLQWFDMRENEFRSIFNDHAENFDAMALSNDGKLLATISSNGPVQLWGAETGRLSARSPKDFDQPISLDFPQGETRQLCITTREGSSLWDLQTGEVSSINCRRKLRGPITILPNGETALLPMRGGVTEFYDIKTGDCIFESKPLAICGQWLGQNSRKYKEYIRDTLYTFSPDGQTVAIASRKEGSKQYAVKVLDAKCDQLLSVMVGALNIRGIRHLPDGRISVSAYWPDIVWCWKAHEGVPELEPQWPDGQPATLTALPTLVQEDDVRPDQPTAQYFEVQSPEGSPENLRRSLSSCLPDIDKKIGWITFGGCKIMPLPPGETLLKSSVRETSLAMSFSSGDLIALKFTNDWLSKITESRMHCSCIVNTCRSLREALHADEDLSRLYHSGKFLELRNGRIRISNTEESEDDTDIIDENKRGVEWALRS